MEENSSKAHMETDVSSTTEDVVEVQELTSSHCNVETVIVVENIKEEEMSPSKNNTNDKTPQPDGTQNSPVPPRIVEKLPHELTIKKIMIKSPLKTIESPKLVQKSPTKSDDAVKSAGKDKQVNSPAAASVSQKLDGIVDSSAKVDAQKSPSKDSETKTQESPGKDTVIQRVIITPLKEPQQKSPIKDSQTTSPTKESQLKNSTIDTQLKSPIIESKLICSIKEPKLPELTLTPIFKAVAKPNQSLLKDAVPKITISKESLIKVSPTKEPIPKLIISKDTSKVPTVREVLPNASTPKTVTNKESKTVTNKETKTVTNKESKTVTNKETKNLINKETKTLINKETKTLINKEAKIVMNKETKPVVTNKETSVHIKTTVESSPSILEDTNTKQMPEISMEVDKEASNDSHMETNSDTSEKEHNKSISRELRSLINSAKESKIISECTQLTGKTRKSRAPLDSSNTSLNASVEADKIQGVRRCSNNSQKSSSSEQSDKTTMKRSMRSQNPEFVTKVKNFLNTVTGKTQKDDDETTDEELEDVKAKVEEVDSSASNSKKKKLSDEKTVSEKSNKLRSDPYCWRCHYLVEPAYNEKVHVPLQCTVCPRSFHFKCLTSQERSKVKLKATWVCPECLLILHAESSESRSPAMKKINLGALCELLKHALERMMDLHAVEPFMQPVDRSVFPDYDKYIVHPMDLSLMKEHIAEGLYGSTEAFLADAQWILHNSIIFNTFPNERGVPVQSKLTGGARALVRSCRAEMGEIEACPECYAAAHARKPTWFTDVCTTPHILVWAKLKGFPYWPAKGMSVSSAGLVDVRFFGAHDRAWVPARDCFLFCEKDPNNFRTKRQDILDSMQEAAQHIRNIIRKYGKFVYPPFKTLFDATKLNEQLKMMIPSFEGEVRTPVKDKPNSSPGMVKENSRSNSKSSKGSLNDGDMSDAEDSTPVPSRKMADGAEIAREEEDYAVENEKDKTMEVDITPTREYSRKRRRSELEEAVMTILNNPKKEKKKRVESDDKPAAAKIQTDESSSSKEVTQKPKETPKTTEKVEEKFTPPKTNNQPPSTVASVETKPKVGPIRLISISKVMQSAQGGANKDKDNNEKSQKPKQKLVKSDSTEKDRRTPEEKPKSEKRRNSKSNKSLNNTTSYAIVQRPEKSADKAPEEKSKDKEVAEKGKNTPGVITSTPNSHKTKDRVRIDDDTTLAVIARDSVKNNIITITSTGLPTISSVRSLSTNSQKDTTTSKPAETTVEARSDSSIFTPTSTDNVRNMKEAVNKLQKLRNDEPLVGRVGVRAFARMTSPNNETPNSNMQVEIKTEPVDLDDADRQMEKLDLMNAFRLRPVNPTGLRDVRMNKVVVALPPKGLKRNEVRPRAKKTFPQPKKAEEGRSELNSKNSMVYIPIQPPMTQAPVRLPRPAMPNGPPIAPAGPRCMVPVPTTAANNVNTVTAPLIPVTMSTLCSPSTSAQGSNSAASPQTVPTVGQVPTTVHTVPLITTVNGQWTFSLQPVMSVGGGDGPSSPPMMNGLPDRNAPPLLPIASAPPLVPIAPAPPPTSTPISVAPPPQTVTAPPTTQTPTRSSDVNMPVELPRLQQRPSLQNPFDVNTPVGSLPPPSTAGPITARLNQNAVKLTDFFRTLLEDSLERLDEPATQLTSLKLQLEQISWRHKQEIDEVKHNHELAMAEMRSSFEKEKVRLVSETRRAAQVELEAAVKLAKTKQWCANCNQEAQFYCCWNTSYCDYPCQRAHWTQHYALCTQQRSQDDNNGSDGNVAIADRLQPAPENLPKTTAAPALTIGGKLAPSRVYTQDQLAKNPSILVSMVEDPSGNQTMKCVGTYKPATAAQMSPLIINKQLMANDDAAKKVVTSGGYLIVGAAPPSAGAPSSAASIVTTPSRRAHTLHYYP